MSGPRVIVAGGGVIGCAIAYYLSRGGAEVILLEREEVAAGASGAAAGMLAPLAEAPEDDPFHALCLRSFERFPALVEMLRAETGIDPQFVRSGILRIPSDRHEARAMEAAAARWQRFDVQWLSAREALRREPALHPRLPGALYSPHEGHVFSPSLTRAYAQAACRHGASLFTGRPVTGLVRQSERVTGVLTPEGAIHGDWVVLAAGPWTGFLAEHAGLTVPLVPVRGQILALAAPAGGLRHIVWGAGAYLVPKLEGSIVVGATEELVGFDRRTTAAGLAGLLAAAPQLVPALAEATFLRAWAGLRPATPDRWPVIGPCPGVEGLIVAAGHYRNGVLLSPITGEAVAQIVLAGKVAEWLAPFSPARFAGGSPGREPGPRR